MRYNRKFNILVTTKEIIYKDADLLDTIIWQCLVVDEAHNLKNRDSAFFLATA